MPRHFPKSGVAELFTTAHVLGLKGCTVFRTGARIGAIKRDAHSTAIREDAAAEHGRTSGRAID